MKYKVNQVHNDGNFIRLGELDIPTDFDEEQTLGLLVEHGMYNAPLCPKASESMWFDGDEINPRREFHIVGPEKYLYMRHMRGSK